MKKMTKIIPILSILITSVLVLLYIDFKEASTYLRFKNFEVESMSIRYDNNQENTIEIVKMMQHIARENNVILAKTNIDSKKGNGNNVYLSVESIDDLNKLLSKNFKVKYFSNENTEKSFISTYDQYDGNQIGIIKDLLGDHYYTYYLMNQMIEKNDSLFGTYFIFYNDFNDYSNFINEVNELMGYDTHSIALSNNIENYLSVLIGGNLIFLLLFYFIFQVYEYYNNSKKIGCMRLLGFDINKINKKMIYKNLKVYVISILVVLVVMLCFAKNIMLSHILLITLVNLLIILFTCVISNWSCRVINKTYETTHILKKQNTTLKISKVSYRFRVIMTVMLITFSMIALEHISILYDKLKIYNASKDLLEYGIFDSYTTGQPELYDHDKQYQLYLNIVHNMETFYAQFSDYSQLTADDWLNVRKDEEEGNFYLTDSVDKNYLEKEKIKVYDLNGKEIDLNTIKGIYFLFPKSKKYFIESFKNFHEEEKLNDYYLEFDAEYVFRAYLYDDRIIDTYRIELDSKYIESPILRVVDISLSTPYFYDGLGISLFGNGMGTGLKIKLIDGDKEKTMNVLNKYIEETKLSNLLNNAGFTTYKEYFNDEILASQLLVLFISLAIIIILIVYTLISFQLLKLYIKSQKQRILVKKMLGFENNNIFEQVFRKSLNNTLVAIVLSLIILIIIKKLGIAFIILGLCILILDFLITLLSIKSTKLSTIYLDLKGEDL